jgi:hypothetical protein
MVHFYSYRSETAKEIKKNIEAYLKRTLKLIKKTTDLAILKLALETKTQTVRARVVEA